MVYHKLGSVVERDTHNTHPCYIHRWEHHNHHELSLNHFDLNHCRIVSHHCLSVSYSPSEVHLNHYDLHRCHIVSHKLGSYVEHDMWNAHPYRFYH